MWNLGSCDWQHEFSPGQSADYSFHLPQRQDQLDWFCPVNPKPTSLPCESSIPGSVYEISKLSVGEDVLCRTLQPSEIRSPSLTQKGDSARHREQPCLSAPPYGSRKSTNHRLPAQLRHLQSSSLTMTSCYCQHGPSAAPALPQRAVHEQAESRHKATGAP